MDLKILTNNIDGKTTNQVYEIARSRVALNEKIRIMPDAHFGASGPIGLSMTYTDRISPSLIGSDIGCGITLYEFELSEPLDLDLLKENIVRIPINRRSGKSLRGSSHLALLELMRINTKGYLSKEQYDNSMLSIGTLGGGNHFIEIYQDESYKGNKYNVAIHSGSRALGGHIYNHYKSKATDGSIPIKEVVNGVISELKEKGLHSEIEEQVKLAKAAYDNSTPKYLEFITGSDLESYIEDVTIARLFAQHNRDSIAMELFDLIIRGQSNALSKGIVTLLHKPHNYVDERAGIIRKGVQEAIAGGVILVPINMRDGIIIGSVTSDKDILNDWNYSAPHGAGRVMSRGDAKRNLSFEEFEKEMSNVASISVDMNRLDEAPGAYKQMDQILDDISPLLVDFKILKPIFNHKG